VDDRRRIEAYLREGIVVQPDGRVQPKIPNDVSQSLRAAFLTERRDYTQIKSAALAIYAESMFEVHQDDPVRRSQALLWERRYMAPFREKSIARIRRQIANVEVVRVPGAHDSFFITSRDKVVQEIERFLDERRAASASEAQGLATASSRHEQQIRGR